MQRRSKTFSYFYYRSYISSPVRRWQTMDVWCDCWTHQWWPQRALLYHLSDKDWQAHHVELCTHMQHQHNIKGMPMWKDKKIIREIRDIFSQTIARGALWTLPGGYQWAKAHLSKVGKERLRKTMWLLR